MNTVYKLKVYAIFLSIALFVGCENWDLTTVSASLTDGLIAYYPFNGNTLDESGNGLNGQLINGATYGSDRKETSQSALFLDGIDDYFEIPDRPKLSPDSISISFWVKVRQVKSSSHFYNKANWSDNMNQQYSAYIRPDDSSKPDDSCCAFYVDVNNDGPCTLEQPIKNPVYLYDRTYQKNQWYHIVTVFSGQTIKLYINSELRISQKESAKPIDKCVGGNLRFGAQANQINGSPDPNYFDGLFDEIRIYSRGLSETEINALYKR